MYDLCPKSTNRMAFPLNKHCSIRSQSMNKMHRGTSLEHILKEITNFGGLEAETEASLNELMSLDTRIATRAKSVDTLNKRSEADSSTKHHKRHVTEYNVNRFKDLLVNENVIIVEKTSTTNEKEENNQDDNLPDDEKSEEKRSGDLPVPNTVRRCKDIFETLSNKPKNGENPSRNHNKIIVGRSISVRVTSADWKRAGNKPGGGITAKLDGLNLDQEERRRTLPGRLAVPQDIDSPLYTLDEARDWMNACSPVSPDVIQKLRERGTSMTFFGRPAYTPSPSPTSDPNENDWKKPRIIGITHKVQKGICNGNKAPSSLCSSSTCSDEELHFASSFDFPSTDTEFHQRPNEHQADDDSGHEDYYSYDVVFLDGTYPRSTASHVGFIKKGVWLRDPFWSGSNYIVYDFRGTKVTPHIKQQ